MCPRAPAVALLPFPSGVVLKVLTHLLCGAAEYLPLVLRAAVCSVPEAKKTNRAWSSGTFPLYCRNVSILCARDSSDLGWHAESFWFAGVKKVSGYGGKTSQFLFHQWGRAERFPKLLETFSWNMLLFKPDCQPPSSRALRYSIWSALSVWSWNKGSTLPFKPQFQRNVTEEEDVFFFLLFLCSLLGASDHKCSEST